MIRSWKSALKGLRFLIDLSTQASPSVARRRFVPWASRSSSVIALALEKSEQGRRIALTLFDIGEVGGLEHHQRRSRNAPRDFL